MSEKDYLEVEYTVEKRPLTSYPAKLAQYIFTKFDLQKGEEILEVGSGRSELLGHFKNLGLVTYAIDSASSAETYAKSVGAKFEKFEISKTNKQYPFENKKFDVTHVKPFTTITLNQALELTNFKNIQVFRFRQLPSTWNSKTINLTAKISALVAHHRTKNKWFRWSRELLIGSIGTK
jgi:hypothetical protein